MTFSYPYFLGMLLVAIGCLVMGWFGRQLFYERAERRAREANAPGAALDGWGESTAGTLASNAATSTTSAANAATHPSSAGPSS